MKIKLKTTGLGGPTPTGSVDPTPVSATQKISFKIGNKTKDAPSQPPTDPTNAPEETKAKRKYTKKKTDDGGGEATDGLAGQKRKVKDLDGAEDGGSAAKKAKDGGKATGGPIKLRLSSMSSAVVPTVGSIASTANLPKLNTTQRISLNTGRSASTPHIKLKTKGHPPVRPLGVGYDSEGDDIEVDPAIESQFILRMQEGPDCEYMRKAIAEKKIGLRLSEGGADIRMKFFDKDGRKGMVTIQGQHYTAYLLDLPCIIEGMKSWDRRGWYKSADICQILVVDKKMPTEEAVRHAPLPSHIQKMSGDYPHGLTPPMHYVRKRRFRHRVSYRTIEHVEDEVERLIREDDAALATGGRSDYKLVNPENENGDSEDAYGEEEDEGAYGDVIPGYAYEEQEAVEADEGDEMDFAALMEQELAQAAVEDASMMEENATVTSQPIHASPDALTAAPLPETAAVSPAATNGTQGDDEDADDLFGDDDDADDADDDEIDEEEQARQRELAQQREEIEDLRKEVADAEKAATKQTNPLLRQRALGKVKSLKDDLRLKLASIGEEMD